MTSREAADAITNLFMGKDNLRKTRRLLMVNQVEAIIAQLIRETRAKALEDAAKHLEAGASG